ncbi:hypothetical protein [Nonomuraea sp. NPDC050783]|uniref:hypothetical protein n=1 Tax=Nonomuraea sp. NPDC050783 TaxID=3154634 RepID=UPI0034665556
MIRAVAARRARSWPAATVIVRLRLDHAGYLELLRGFPLGDHLAAQDGDACQDGACLRVRTRHRRFRRRDPCGRA